MCFAWLRSGYETESIPVLFQSTPVFGGNAVGKLATHQTGAAALMKTNRSERGIVISDICPFSVCWIVTSSRPVSGLGRPFNCIRFIRVLEMKNPLKAGSGGKVFGTNRSSFKLL